jgi:hypothetical protein
MLLRTTLAAALTFAATTLTSLPAPAADILLETRADKTVVGISGKIEAGDDLKFTRVVNALPSGTNVVLVMLESPGGELTAGLNIGVTIRKRGYTTGVSTHCASMCALIWLAGTPRYFGEGAEIGFHAAYTTDTEGNTPESGQGNALVGAYLAHLGLSYDAIAFLTEAPPDDLNYLTPVEARRLGISIIFKPNEISAPPPQMPQLPPMAPLPDVPYSTIFPHLYTPPATKLAPVPPATNPTTAPPPYVDPYPSVPRPLAPYEKAAATTPAYVQGRNNRLAYEQWLHAFEIGTPYYQGVMAWINGRTPPEYPSHAPSCQEKPEPRWRAGCEAARERLAPIDRRRATDANYAYGWNSL